MAKVIGTNVPVEPSVNVEIPLAEAKGFEKFIVDQATQQENWFWHNTFHDIWDWLRDQGVPDPRP